MALGCLHPVFVPGFSFFVRFLPCPGISRPRLGTEIPHGYLLGRPCLWGLGAERSRALTALLSSWGSCRTVTCSAILGWICLPIPPRAAGFMEDSSIRGAPRRVLGSACPGRSSLSLASGSSPSLRPGPFLRLHLSFRWCLFWVSALAPEGASSRGPGVRLPVTGAEYRAREPRPLPIPVCAKGAEIGPGS